MGRPNENASKDDARHNGQNHDRMAAEDFKLAASPAVDVNNSLPPVPRVTPLQTMVSALSGSLLTSLLGI
jgi:hypothetical protein